MKRAKKSKAGIIKYILIRGTIFYGLVLVFMFSYQRNLQYFPHKDLAKPSVYGIDMEEVEFVSVDGTKIMAWYKESHPDKPIFVFFHGNGGHLGHRAYKYKNIISRGFGLLALSYRGFGLSEGSASEEGLYNDARAAINFLRGKDIGEKNMVLYGESLGTGIASHMAVEYDFKAVILESPYTSLADVGQDNYPYIPVKLLIRDNYDTLSKIVDVTEPLLVMHGEKDRIIPVAYGKKVFQAANEPKKLVIYPDKYHNDFGKTEDMDRVVEFLDSVN